MKREDEQDFSGDLPISPGESLTPHAAGARPIRDCSFIRTGKDKWAVWAWNGVRWDFQLHPARKLWRRGWEMEHQPALLCLDDAVLFITGWEAAHDEAVQKGVRP